MKKLHPSALILIGFTLFTAVIISIQYYRTSQKPSFGKQSVLNASFSNDANAIELLEEKVKEEPKNIKLKKQLGFAYIRMARSTGNSGLYDPLALKLFDSILTQAKGDYEAMIGKATVLLSQHHFSDALVIGQEAIQENPYSSSCYGVLTDALLETGDYEKSVAMVDKMVSLHPDLRSYSRVSYLREIYGDYAGAKEAMQMAVKAGIEGMEETEWARYQLACLYERTGEIAEADTQFHKCVFYRPNFTAAYLGVGRIAQKRREYAEAEKEYLLAKNLSGDYTIYEHLAKLYREENRQKEAAIAIRQSIAALEGKDGKGNVHGHYADRELALLYLNSYDYNKALIHAQIEYDRRPENIDVNHTLAWVYYKRGEYAKASQYIVKALKTNSKDPELLYHAGLIHLHSGSSTIGAEEMNAAIETNPHLDRMLQLESKYVM